MAVDDMFMENLDEFVNDENKVVTFKWLSTNLKVHVNQAKQMLYAFVQQERNKKDNDKLNVTYFVAGIPKNKNGCVAHQCIVTPEEELEAVKSTFSTVTSCHIYSVQKVKLKDPGTLYLADYDNTKDKIHSCSRYSAITCPRAMARSKEELAKLGIKTASTQGAESAKINGSSSVPKASANGTSNTKVKAEPKGSIANMFAGSGGKKSDKTADVKPKEEVKEKAKQAKGGKSSGMKSFFSKQTEKPKPAEEKAESKKEDKENKKEDADEEEPALPALKDDKKGAKKEKKQETKKGRQAKGKKSTRVSDSDDEDKPDKKRRKRIRNDLFDSSSESEMDILKESPVPSPVPSPIREPSPAPESPVPEKIQESDEEVQVVTETNASQKRRKRTRKLVPKTFMDDEGFMVTEKVWESDSTDASETEEVKKKPSPAKQTKTQGSKKPSPHKKSPQKGAAKSQMSLTSFFKKK